MLLEGKVLYVSGAGGTIGRAIGLRAAREGASVVLGDIDEAAVGELAASLRADGFDALAVAHDVTDARATERALAVAVGAHGRVDVACANAGIGEFAAVCEMPDALWERTLAINLTGVMHTLRAFGRHMVGRQSGALVVTASISSLRGAPLLGAYCASKFAVMGLAESMAKEVGPHGVRVNCVCPGPVEGPLAQGMVARTAERFGQSLDEARDDLVAPIALGRLVDADDVAEAACWLGSDRARFVTGQRLVVDGGMLAK